MIYFYTLLHTCVLTEKLWTSWLNINILPTHVKTPKKHYGFLSSMNYFLKLKNGEEMYTIILPLVNLSDNDWYIIEIVW